MYLFVVNVLSILLGVGLYTLIERKVLALSQLRLGPNKTWVYGCAQPLLDALKLMKKSISLNIKLSLILVYFFCCFMLVMSLLLWLSIPFKGWVSSKSLIVFWVLTIISLGSFTVLMLGWSSGGKYPMMGSVRSICQTMTLEITLTIILLSYFLLFSSLSFILSDISIIYVNMILYLTGFFIVMLMETHRAPFDVSEGESEIVSGYNTEFSSVLFVLIFLSEYSNLMFLGIFVATMMMFKHVMFFILIMSLVLIVRTCFPRVRYDLMMNYSWMKILPSIIYVSLFTLSNKSYM